MWLDLCLTKDQSRPSAEDFHSTSSKYCSLTLGLHDIGWLRKYKKFNIFRMKWLNLAKRILSPSERSMYGPWLVIKGTTKAEVISFFQIPIKKQYCKIMLASQSTFQEWLKYIGKLNTAKNTWFSSACCAAPFVSSFLARLDLSLGLAWYLDRTSEGKSSIGTTPSIPYSVNCSKTNPFC